jgi:type IV secretory pathway VirB10-like protein
MSLLDRLAQALKQAPPPPPGPPAPQVTNQTASSRFLTKPRIAGLVFAAIGLLWVFTGSTPKRSTAPPAPGLGLHNTDPTAAASMFAREMARVPDAATAERAAIESEMVRRNAAMYGAPPAGYPYAAPTPIPGQYPVAGPAAPPAEDPVKADQKRREYASLFASPVIPIAGDSLPVQEARMPREPEVQPAPGPTAAPAADKALVPSKATPSHDCVDEREPGGETVYAVCEGSFIEARLTNRLDGEAPGPVIAVTTRDVRSRDRLHVVIPAGTTLIGEASAVSGQYQRRLQVAFHRVIMPDGRGVDLTKAIALDRLGSAGLHDTVDRHVTSLILTTIATGGLSALAQAGTGGYYNGNGIDAVRQSMGQSAAQIGQQQFGRTASRQPSITIREGQIVNLFLNTDIKLKEWN